VVRTAGIAVPAGSAGVQLGFWHRWNFENGFDGGRVMLGLATTGPFTYVGASYLSGQGYTAVATDVPSFTGTQATMVNTLVDLSDFCTDNATAGFNPNCGGQTIYVAFQAYTDPATQAAGWYIDDVTVTQGTGAACNAAPSPVSFLTATGKDTQVTAQWLNPATYTGPTRLCQSTGGFAPDPGAVGCPAPVNKTGAASTADSTTFTGLTDGQSQFLTAFVGNASAVFSARRNVIGLPIVTTAAAKWNFSTNAAALSPPLQSSGIGLFAGANDRALHAMQLSGAGAGLWPASWAPAAMNGPAQEQPLVLPASYTGFAFPAVFVGSQDGFVYCFRADTGAGCPGWAAGGRSASLGGVVQATPMIYFAPLAANRLLLVGTRISGGTNALYALKIADGTVATNWPFTNTVAQLGDGKAMGIVSGPAFVDAAAQRAYFATRASTVVGGSANTVWAVDFASGSPHLAWAVAVGDIDGAVTQDWTANHMLVGTNTGAVLALDPTSGATVWSRSFGDGPVKDFVYYSSVNARFYFSTTSTVWSIPASGATGSDWSVAAFAPSRPLLHAGTTRTYVGGCATAACSAGRVIELDSANSWATPKTFDVPASGGLGAVVIDRNQSPAMLFAGSRGGRIYAIVDPLP
jgi:outer membrane protein assembly factor BamB